MKTIGLVGGVASGKSLAAQMLVELGAGLLDADRTGHAVLADDQEVREALRHRFGEAVFSVDGHVDRLALARRVFAEGENAAADREFLENLLHPRIHRRLQELRQQFAAQGKSAAVLDAPLLLEAGWRPICDVVLMIDAPRASRLGWARQRGWNDAEFARREAAQWPVERKCRDAHVVIQNDGTIDDLRSAVRDFWDRHIVGGVSDADPFAVR